MSNTAHLKLYQINEVVTLDQITDKITKQDGYSFLPMKALIQEKNGVELFAYQMANYYPPDWVSLIMPYIEDSSAFSGSKRYSLILLLGIKSLDEKKKIFAVTGGSGALHLARFVDHSFGISVLERIFDPELNKLYSVKEKAVIGDVLASSRYYRRSRALAYEDDFGKCFQNISIRIIEQQIKQFFPSLALFKPKKKALNIALNCSSNLDICMKIDLLCLVRTIHELVLVLNMPPKMIFNKALIPIDKKIDKELLAKLNTELLFRIIGHARNEHQTFDIDFCPQNFEDFFSSSKIVFSLPGFQPRFGSHRDFNKIEIDDFISSDISDSLADICIRIEESKEYQDAEEKDVFIKNALNETSIVTLDTDGRIQTSGKLLDFCNAEISIDETSYFLLDNTWYELKSKFDDDLNEKYREKVTKHIEKYEFIKGWEGKTEDDYNTLYNSTSNPFELHKIKVGNIELCDALFVDHAKKKTYIIHVKDGIGASIRDLVSQAFISARIIEEEARTKEKAELKLLYTNSVKAKRINTSIVTEAQFINYFMYSREYCLVIHNRISGSSILEGNIKSRIAKFSLIEYATVMYLNEFGFSIIEI